MIVITTMEKLPESCYECPLCVESWCNAIYLSKDSKWQSAQEYRPYNCPLKDVPEPKKEET